jgi:dephospho-CoA kinase
MITLGITGGIGAGKSETAEYLEELGIPVLDTDQVAREVVMPGRPALAEVVSAFGEGILDAQGHLDRAALARRVFQDDAARASLERILHPRIHEVWMAWLQRQASFFQPIAAVVIPLLYEKGYQAAFRAVIALGCSETTQRQRLRQRLWTEEMIDQRLAAQWSMTEKLRRADHVLWSEGQRSVLREQVDSVLRAQGWLRR